MTVRAAVTELVIFLLSVPVVQSQTYWEGTYSRTEVCALEGSTVELSYTYTYPATRNFYYASIKTLWFTKEENNRPVDVITDSQYTGRVMYNCGLKQCTLRITNVEKSDSATYKFTTNQASGRYVGNPGAVLSVTDLQVTRTGSWSTLDLKCHSPCPLPRHVSYVWYKNGHKISAEESSYSDNYAYADSYSCALKGNENSPSPLYCYYDSYCNKVKYSHRTICASRGSSVDISCSYRSYESISSKFWFKAEQSQQGQYYLKPKDLRENLWYLNRVQVTDSESGDTTLRISDLRESDSAVYRFTFTAGSSGWGTSLYGTTLTVTALQVKVMRITTEAELRCHSSCSEADRLSYVWFRNGQRIPKERKSSFKGRYNPGDEISCALEGHERFPSPSVYAPRLPSVSVSPSRKMIEGSSVTLRCSSDANPAANYAWYKVYGIGDPWSFGAGPQLSFSSVRPSASGQYYCSAENELGRRKSEFISLTVKYAPRLPSVSVSPSGKIKEGSSVTLNCHSDADQAANYKWYKKYGVGDPQLFRTGPQLSFSSIQPSDSGLYHCSVEFELGRRTSEQVSITVKYAPRLPSVSVSPSAETVEGSSVILNCSSDANPAANYTWYRTNGGGDSQFFRAGPQLNFSSIQPSDSGQYYCSAENELGRRTSELISITVKYAPRLPSVSVSPSENITEGSLVNLNCSSDANPAANYTWYRTNGDGDPQFFRPGPQLSLSSIQPSDSGLYDCSAENELGRRTSELVSISVKYAPRLPSVSVNPSAETTEGSSVILNCSSDANPAASYTWYRTNGGGDSQFFRAGPQLNFSSIQPSDSGQYYCSAENELGRRTSELDSITVKYAPKLPSVSVSPSAETVEGSSVTLTCSSDANPAAKYTWYRTNGDGDPQFFRPGPQLSLSSIQPSDSGLYDCSAENELGRRTSELVSISVKYAPRLPSVSVNPSAETTEGSSVILNCSSDANPAASYTWYRTNGGGDSQLFRTGPQLSFGSIQPSDSGQYYCSAENELGRRTSELDSITVKYAPKLPSVSVSPSAETVEGSSVTLTCSSDANPAAKYTWYRTNGDGDPQFFRPGPQLSLSSIQPSDSGLYDCLAENELGRRTSELVLLTVKYAPRLPSVSVNPSAEIEEGSSVTLNCSSDANPAANYTWYKENRRAPQGLQGLYLFTTISPEDTGTYYCTSENQYGRINSSSVFIDVQYAPRLPSVSVSPSAEIVEGASVNLTCSIDANPAANYTWYKENQKLPRGTWQNYNFPSIRSEDEGIYHCQAWNKHGQKKSSILFIDVQYAPKLPTVSVSPSAEIVEGASVNLTCSSDANPAANYTWYKENQKLPRGTWQNYNFPSIRSEDEGIYQCQAWNKHGQKKSSILYIDVQYAPKLPSVSVSPSAEIVKGSSLNLTCSSDANPAANYTWYKENEDSPLASGQIFTITEFHFNHSGNYYCEAQNTRGCHNSTFTLTVVSVPVNSAFIASIIRMTLLLLLLIPLLPLVLWIRKEKNMKTELSEPAEEIELNSDPVYENILTITAAFREDREEQEDTVRRLFR
ncbi:basement membrane-specific heparan sulfate proteoglycan core protein-like isoform X1 [Cheilinus undulatus]|uniref:basement membrane-specific heparan sulfate proteoglycan core protein-like isoform X1 n=1 Tax=Cheilinus undulatus TaxID=241271 RepID=UPI001BD1E5BC|nr:basement membrane-specific heparan sulfate proteoglycan core protein-like isoform X1 [Cheilinus undulatus]